MITEEHRKRIDRLFLRFAAMYGHVWKAQFKNDEFLVFVKGEWQEGLLGYEEKTLDSAIKLCRVNKVFPPTLPQFIDFCEQCSNKNKFFKVEKSLKHQSPEVAKTHLQKIKELLNMKFK